MDRLSATKLAELFLEIGRSRVEIIQIHFRQWLRCKRFVLDLVWLLLVTWKSIRWMFTLPSYT